MRTGTGRTMEALAELTTAADCLRRKVAAVIVDPKVGILGRGKNSLPAGSCSGGDCPRGLLSYEEQPKDVDYLSSGCLSTHAEVEAIRDAGLLVSESCVLFVTETPCSGCAAAIAEAGITKVVTVSLDHPTFTNRVGIPRYRRDYPRTTL